MLYKQVYIVAPARCADILGVHFVQLSLAQASIRRIIMVLKDLCKVIFPRLPGQLSAITNVL